MSQGKLSRRIRGPVKPLIVIVFLLGLAALLAWRGLDFYQLDLDARVDHEDFRILGPGEGVGHGYGIVGTALILTNLLYLVRRRLARWPLGSVRVWLDMHVVTGLVGGVLIVFHSAFQLRTPIASLTSVSLLIVVLTGVIGRYLYTLSPNFDDALLRTQCDALDTLVPNLGERVSKSLAEAPITDPGGNASLPRALITIPMWIGEVFGRRKIVFDQIEWATLGRPPLPGLEAKLLERVSRETASLAASQVRAVAAGTLLRTWRGLHRLLAILLILTVSVHIAVAWYYGYRWVWSE